MFYYKIRRTSSVSSLLRGAVLLSASARHGEGRVTSPGWAARARRAGRRPGGPSHWALEAVVVVDAAPLAEATVNRELWMDSVEAEVTWRLATGPEFPAEAAAAETKLTGLLVSRERF